MTPPERARALEPLTREIAACGSRLHELRRYLLAEVAPMERSRIEAHLKACGACRERLDALRREAEEVLREVDVAQESAEILRRLEQESGRGRSAWERLLSSFLSSARSRALRPAIAGALLLLVLVPLARLDRGEGVRTKGASGVTLEMFVKEQNGARQAADGEVLKEGDQVQFRYRAMGRRYVLVVSVTSRGVLSPLYPDRPDESIPVAPEGTHVLEGSVILDASRGPERIFAFFSDQPLPYDEVKGALESDLRRESDITALHRVDLAREDVEEATVLIFKE